MVIYQALLLLKSKDLYKSSNNKIKEEKTMTDTKTLIMKKEMIQKLKNRVNAMQKGEKIKAAEFVFISLNEGFSYATVRTFLESYKDLDVVSLGYRDGKIYEVTRL